ncbi:MAG: PHP domain-containing protein [Bacteroidetes bacterium]|nr:PHP domain-containing protein [Bacteroidota bacterium]MDA1121975.1 PHP domain-containing protein [Bacteroidota bacterium]
MENQEIIRQLSLTASLMELHGENPFKLRSYTNAAFNLEKFQTPLELLPIDELEDIDGVGKSIAAHIREIVDNGIYGKLDKLAKETPKGIIELLKLQGFGAKKIRALWLDLGITNEAELVQACLDGRVAEMKGFGEKSQATLMDAITFLRSNRGKLLYVKAEKIFELIQDELNPHCSSLSAIGELRRKCEIITTVEVLVATDQISSVKDLISGLDDFELSNENAGPFSWKGLYKPTETKVIIQFCSTNRFVSEQMLLSGSSVHLAQIEKDGTNLFNILRKNDFESELQAYQFMEFPFIEPELREGLFEVSLARDNKLPSLITDKDLKGILHNHSTYSDGRHTLEDMANYCKELGYQYLGITDHSKSAFFARGMSEEKVAEQHAEIEALNNKLAPFRIFKGIESDILFDGSLDYPDEILASFDFVIASVHMILNMDEKKATDRVIKAVTNPFTTILGHPTGRLLLGREGYPLNHKAVIDACADHKVVIEINANPHRLDLDWRWIQYALEKNVMLSINPDAHRKASYHDLHYGILVARKGGLNKEMNLNSMDMQQIEDYFNKRKRTKLLTV